MNGPQKKLIHINKKTHNQRSLKRLTPIIKLPSPLLSSPKSSSLPLSLFLSQHSDVAVGGGREKKPPQHKEEPSSRRRKHVQRRRCRRRRRKSGRRRPEGRKFIWVFDDLQCSSNPIFSSLLLLSTSR